MTIVQQRIVRALTLVLVLAVPASAHAAAAPGVFSGTLGLPVPKGARATVHAVTVADGAVVAVRDVGRSGAFSLRLPPGAYIVRGTVVPRRGRVRGAATPVSLRPGQRRTRATLKARRRASTRRAASRGRAAYVTERGNRRSGSVAAGISTFTTNATGDLGALVGGIDDLLINDVLQASGARCPGRVTLREVTRLADALREFELGKSRYADKSTFPKRNLIVLDVAVGGRLTVLPDKTARVAVTLTESRTGKPLGGFEVEVDPAMPFAGLDRVGPELAAKLCELSETFEVTLDVAGEGRFATHSATARMRAVLLARWDGDAWTATGPLGWESAAFMTKTECPYIDVVVPEIAWGVTITDQGDGLSMTWRTDGNDSTTASVDCPPGGPDDPDPPPIPGQAGTALINTGPMTYALPYTGATTPIAGGVEDGGDGFFNAGTMTVKPLGITAPPG